MSTLTNYYWSPKPIVSGVAWTLAVEVLFYLLCLLILPLLKKYYVLSTLIILVICVGANHLFMEQTHPLYLLTASLSYVPFLLSGQLLYFFWSKKIGLYSYLGLLTLTFLSIIDGLKTINTSFYAPDQSYASSFVYAYALFVILLLLEKQLKLPKFFRFFSDISYSLYLYHRNVGLLVLALLCRVMDYTLAMPLTFGLMCLVSYLSWRFVEKPSQIFARKIVNRQR